MFKIQTFQAHDGSFSFKTKLVVERNSKISQCAPFTKIEIYFNVHCIIVVLGHTQIWDSHTKSKGFLRVDGMRKKLCDEMVCFCLMHMQRSLLCPF